MKNKLALILVFCLVSILSMCLVACNSTGENQNEELGLLIPEYIKPTINATYGQTLADLALPQGFTWDEAATTSVGNAGPNTFHVTYTPEDTTKFQVVKGIAVTVQVAKVSFDMSGITFGNAQFTYDGQPHSLAIAGTLPEGVVVYYENNEQTDVGTYEVRAVFSVDGNHNPVEPMPATLTIVKSDIQGLSLADAQFTYDGTAKSLAISGTVPAGVQVTYENNYNINAGTYNVTAHFAGGANYNNLPDLHATMVIGKATVTGLTFADATYTYDGTEKKIEVQGNIPTGVDVVYTNNVKTNVGSYLAVATFEVNDNFNEIPSMTAYFNINKADPVFETPCIYDQTTGSYLSDVWFFNPTTNQRDTNAAFEDQYYLEYIGYSAFDAYYDMGDNYNNVNFTPIFKVYKNGPTLEVDGVRAIFYDADKDLTIRLVTMNNGYQVTTSQIEVTFGAYYQTVFAYVYKGRDFSGVEDSILNSNAESVKIDEIYRLEYVGSGHKFLLNKHLQNFSSGNVYFEESIDYVLDLNETTHVFSIAEPEDYGTLTYIFTYSEIDAYFTIAFYDTNRAYTFNGVYTESTLPQIGVSIGTWISEEENNVTYISINGLEFIQGSGKNLKLYAGENVYRFGYLYVNEEYNESEYYICAYNIDREDSNVSYVYVLNEEVDYKTVDLSNYTPIIESKSSWTLEEVNNVKYVDEYIVDANNELTIDWAGKDYYYQFMNSEGNWRTLILRNSDHKLFYRDWYTEWEDVNSLTDSRGTWEYDADTNTISVEYTNWGETINATFNLSTRNNGSMKRIINGEIVGLQKGIFGGDATMAFVKDGNNRTILGYYSTSFEDILDGKVEPEFDSYEDNIKWKQNGDYISLVYNGVEFAIYTVRQDKSMIEYRGIQKYAIEYQQDPTTTVNITFNEVLGENRAYYSINGINYPYFGEWTINEVGNFLMFLGFEGEYYPQDSFYMNEDDGEIVLTRIDDSYGILWDYDYVYKYDSNCEGNIATYVLALYRYQGNRVAYAIYYDHKVEEKDIPTLKEFNAILQMTDAQLEALGVEVVSTSDVQWNSYGVEFVRLTIDGNNYNLYSKLSRLQVLPYVVSVEYCFQYDEESDKYTELYYIDGDPNRGNIAFAEDVLLTADEFMHYLSMYVEEANVWRTVVKDNKTYMISSVDNYDTMTGLVGENGIELVIGDIVYTLVKDGMIYIFANQLDLTHTVFSLGAYTTAEEMQGIIDAAIANRTVSPAGIWGQTDDYVQYKTLMSIWTHTSESFIYKVIDNALTDKDPSDIFRGVVVDAIYDEFTYFVVDNFGIMEIHLYDGEFTKAQVIEKWNNGDDEITYEDLNNSGDYEYMPYIIDNSLYFIYGKVYEIKDGALSLAQGTIYAWLDEYGDTYIFVQYGNKGLVIWQDMDGSDEAVAAITRFDGYENDLTWYVEDDYIVIPSGGGVRNYFAFVDATTSKEVIMDHSTGMIP